MQKYGVLEGIGDVYISDLSKSGDVEVTVRQSANRFIRAGIPVVKLIQDRGYTDADVLRFMGYVNENTHLMMKKAVGV